MVQGTTMHRMIVKSIAVIYLLLYISAISCSLYLLKDTLSSQPILLIELLKYTLLCVLFLILIILAIRALTLKPQHINRLAVSARNFKWLFTVVVLICIAAQFGVFSVKNSNPVVITPPQIISLLMLTFYCFWSDAFLKSVTENSEEKDEA